jgi:hypothetical protein
MSPLLTLMDREIQLQGLHKLESPLDARRHVDFWAAAGATSFKAYM